MVEDVNIQLCNAEKSMRTYIVENLGSSLVVDNVRHIRKDVVSAAMNFYLFGNEVGSVGNIYYNAKTGEIKHIPTKEGVKNRMDEILRKEGLLS